jgi:RimJ/RimL family protein N-acetyltransferase
LTPTSDLEWMTLQVEGLFVHDTEGRMLRSADRFDGAPAPRFFLGRTRHGSVWRFRNDLADERMAALARLAAEERMDRPLDAPAERIESFRAELARDAPVERETCGPAFRFPDTPRTEYDPSAPAPIALTPDRAELAEAYFPDLVPELADRQPCFGIALDGKVVSVCFCARPLHRSSEAGVGTAPGFRGRGHATRAVAAWAREVQALGGLPLYSTTWTNRASRGVARRLGLIRFGVDLHFR